MLRTDSTPWLFLFNLSVVSLGGQALMLKFYCVFKRQLNAFETTETTSWKKGIGIENLDCNHHRRSNISSFY